MQAHRAASILITACERDLALKVGRRLRWQAVTLPPLFIEYCCSFARVTTLIMNGSILEARRS